MKDNLDYYANTTSYITDKRYISGRIVEYDIKSANITMLRKYNAIDDSYYNYLNRLPKQDREIEVGLLQKNNNYYYKTIKNGIVEAKKKLLYSNNISPDSIIRIANDAVYINTSVDLQYTEFEDVIFVRKSVSSSLLKLLNIIVFFWYNSDGINIDVKGLGDSKYIHMDYILSIIANTIYLLERVSINDALKFISDFYDDYINLRLDKEYYREFNPQSYYHLKNTNYYMIDIDDINNIDIGYNLYILRELWSIILERYNLNIKR